MTISKIFEGISIKSILSKKEELIELWVFMLFLVFLVLIRTSQHLLFHTVAEFFACSVAYGLFFVALNTTRWNDNNFIFFLGIGYFFAGMIDAMHIFTYSGVSIIYPNGDQSLVVQFWIAARYMVAITLLGSIILLIKDQKKINKGVVFFSYFFVSGLIILSILYFKIFPTCYVIGQGLTTFKIVSEYIVTAIILLVAIVYFYLRKNIDFNLFFYMECHLITMAISELLFTSFFSPYDWTNIWSHLIRVISYFFLYKALIENGVKRPYSILFHKINKIDNELYKTSRKLKQEQQQRKIMEEMLVKNDQCYELIINNSSDAIIVICEEKFIFANESAARILGADKASRLIGVDWEEFIPLDEIEKVKSHHKMTKMTLNKTYNFECKIMSLAGDIIDVEIISDYILFQGKLSYINILRDITPKNQIIKLKNDLRNNKEELNETKEYNKLLTEFFSNVSHELKTPLNVILGSIQIMGLNQETGLNSDYQLKLVKYHRVMKQNCYRLLRLVNNLIDLSKFDSGYLNLSLSNQNIISIVEDIVLSVIDYVENRGLTIIFDTEIEEKITAVDADKIERIILNLLSNAIKFTDKGGNIFVNMYDRRDGIAISVKDTGIGIPKDKLEAIFSRFGQVDKTLARNREGSGIGLSLVKTLVEMHGGSISISSVEGKGSEVRMEFPVRLVANEAVEKETIIGRTKVEKINVEFSDIYSYN